MATLTDGALISLSIVAAHYRPSGAPWIPVCGYCAGGRCSALEDAQRHLDELRQRTACSALSQGA